MEKQKLVTVIGVNYSEIIVPDLIEKSFDVYLKKDFNKRHFQVSVMENTYAAAAIVLTVLGIEAYRNRIFYLEKKKVSRSVSRDLSEVFSSKNSSFPNQFFERVLSEVFVVRDVIVHNHIYKVDVVVDKEWEMLSHRQQLLEGYGDDKKFKNFVNNRTRKTKLLKLNVQPAKIGFEDLLISFIIFDLFVGVSNKLLPNNYVPFRFTYKFNDEWVDNISKYLAYFYNQLPNKKFHSKLKVLLSHLRTNFKSYLPDYWNCFLNNCCPKCKEFGFHQLKNIHHCKKCGLEIREIKH